MRWSGVLAAVGATALGVRVVQSRHRRFLHPAGRSFDGELTVRGAPTTTGAGLLDRPARHRVTVRVSKGGGTPGGWPDILGLAIRVPGPHEDGPSDLLLSTAGRGRLSRHLPTPRRGFDTFFGSILAYRAGGPAGRPLYLAAVPEPGGQPWGASLDSVAAAARTGRASLLLVVADGADLHPWAQLTLGRELSGETDAELAFDPVRHTTAGLHPDGLVHATRAAAYRWSQRWRGVRPAAPDPTAVRRTAVAGGS